MKPSVTYNLIKESTKKLFLTNIDCSSLSEGQNFGTIIKSVANVMLIVIVRSDVLEKLRLQMVSYSVLDPNYFEIVCARGLI